MAVVTDRRYKRMIARLGTMLLGVWFAFVHLTLDDAAKPVNDISKCANQNTFCLTRRRAWLW